MVEDWYWVYGQNLQTQGEYDLRSHIYNIDSEGIMSAVWGLSDFASNS